MGAKNSGHGAGGGHMVTALINKTVRIDKLFDASGNEILAGATQDQYLAHLKANPTEAFESNISVKDKVNGVESWTEKGRYDSNGNFLNYTTHTFAPAGWSETKYMDEMRNARNNISDTVINNTIANQYATNPQISSNLKFLNESAFNVTYEIVANGNKYVVSINQSTKKITTFYIKK